MAKRDRWRATHLAMHASENGLTIREMTNIMNKDRIYPQICYAYGYKCIERPIAQRLELPAHNGSVLGSNPSGPTRYYTYVHLRKRRACDTNTHAILGTHR